MYEDNKENDSLQKRQSISSPDNNTINQNNNGKEKDINFPDYESYKKKFTNKDDVISDHKAGNNISDLTFNKTDNNISPDQSLRTDQLSVNQNFPPDQPGYGQPNTQQNPHPFGNQGFPPDQPRYGQPNTQQNPHPFGNQGFPPDQSRYGQPNTQQNPYSNQGFPPDQPRYGQQNAQQNPYPYSNQGFPPDQPRYSPQNAQQNPYSYGNQGFPPDRPRYAQQNPYPYGNQGFPPDRPRYSQQNPYPYGNQGFRPDQPRYGPQNAQQNPYPYGNQGYPPNQPSYGYPGMPQNNYPYGGPSFPPGQFYPRNPRFRPMPKDYYTLNEIKKSYNRTGLTLLIHSVAVFIIQLILFFTVALSIVSSRSGIDEIFTSSKIEFQVALYAVLSYVIANIGCALIGLGFTKRVKEFPRLFKLPRFNIKSAMWAFLAVYGIQGIIHILHSLYFGLAQNTQATSDTSLQEVNPDVLIIFILYSVVLAPITEEILFRGMVLKNLSVYNQKFAIVISALLFGMFHGNFPQMITATLLGILLAYVAVKSDSLIIPIGLHMFNNLSMEIIDVIPDSTAKNISLAVLFFIGGTFGLIMFIISMKKSDTSDTFNVNYERIYELEPANERKASLSSFFSSPAVIIFFIIYFLIIGTDIFLTLSGQ